MNFTLNLNPLRLSINLNVLQKESDSVRQVLNNSIQILAALDESIPKLNPLLKNLKDSLSKSYGRCADKYSNFSRVS